MPAASGIVLEDFGIGPGEQGEGVKMNHLQRFLVMAIFCVMFQGCADTRDNVIVSNLVLHEQAVDRPLHHGDEQDILNTQRMFGTAIGVSRYGDKAQPQFDSKAAHALSAALLVDTVRRDYEYVFQSANKNMSLSTELRLKADDINNFDILMQLSMSIGANAILPHEKFLMNGMALADGSWPYFGNNRLISKKTIIASVARAIQEIRMDTDTDKPVTAIFYISAHGFLAPDGTGYIIPADGVAGQRETWLGFNDFLAPIYHFAAEDNNTDLRKRILVIIDVCQREGRFSNAIDAPPKGVAVIFSSSPGQYAWHFSSHMHLEQHGKPALSATPINTDMDVSSTMSFLPMAMRQSMSELGADLLPIKDGKEEEKNLYEKNISIGTLFNKMQEKMKTIAENDDSVQDSGGQNMRIYYGDMAEQMGFMTLKNFSSLNYLPHSKTYAAAYVVSQ